MANCRKLHGKQTIGLFFVWWESRVDFPQFAGNILLSPTARGIRRGDPHRQNTTDRDIRSAGQIPLLFHPFIPSQVPSDSYT